MTGQYKFSCINLYFKKDEGMIPVYDAYCLKTNDLCVGDKYHLFGISISLNRISKCPSRKTMEDLVEDAHNENYRSIASIIATLKKPEKLR